MKSMSPRKTTKKAGKSSSNKVKIEVDPDYISQCAQPIIQKHRYLTPTMVGHLIQAAYPTTKFTASALRRAVADSFEVVVALPG
jgi:hypothetical protein